MIDHNKNFLVNMKDEICLYTCLYHTTKTLYIASYTILDLVHLELYNLQNGPDGRATVGSKYKVILEHYKKILEHYREF